MKNKAIISKAQGIASIQKSINITMPRNDAEAFLVDTVGKATTLAKLAPFYKNTPAGKIDTLGVSKRRIRQHTGDESPTGVGGITNGQIDYVVKKVFWDEWIKNDDVWYNDNARGEDIEAKVIDLVQTQFGIDLQDLMFNGDTAAKLQDGTTADPFLSILDGFVKKMKTSDFKTDLGSAEPTIDDFINHILVLDEKYLNFSDLTWFMSRRLYQKIVALIQKRPTNLGDTTLVNGKLTEIGGFPIEVVENLGGGFAALTPMSNLKPVFTRELRYNRTAEGSTAAVKDSTYHILFAYADAVVREIDAVAWMTGTKL